MGKKAFLIVDIGGGSSRVGIFSEEGELLTLSDRESIYHVNEAYTDSVYFKPKEWIETLRELVHESISKVGDVDIVAVSSTSMRQGVVMIGKAGESLIGCPNSDMRGGDFVDDLDWDKITEITGLEQGGFYSGFKVLGTQKTEPEVAEKIGKFTSISDWIGYLFTGKIVWERSQAGQSMGYDIQKDSWSHELCELTKIDYTMLPEIGISGDILGQVKPELIKEFGLNPEAVFIIGGSDTQMGLAGVQAEKGDVTAVNGTTTPITMLLDHHRKVPCWISPHVVPNQYMLEINCGSTGVNAWRMKKLFFANLSYDEIEKNIKKRNAMPRVLAMFSEGWMLPDDMCTNVGLFMDDQFDYYVKEDEFMQAMYLDVAFQMDQTLKYLATIEPTKKNYILGCGGAFQSEIEAQALADITGKEVWLPEGYAQGTLFGAYLMCVKAFGISRGERRLEKIFFPRENPELVKYHKKWLAYREKMKLMNDISVVN